MVRVKKLGSSMNNVDSWSEGVLENLLITSSPDLVAKHEDLSKKFLIIWKHTDRIKPVNERMMPMKGKTGRPVKSHKS